MTTDTSDDSYEPNGEPDRLPQHEYVSRMRPDPAALSQPGLVLEGVVGDSDRPGHKRLYFSRSLTEYAEFSPADVAQIEDIPADQPPFVGLDATRVTIRRDAPVTFTRAQPARPLDEFDLDVQLSATTLPARDIRMISDECGGEGTRFPTTIVLASDVCGTRQPWPIPPRWVFWPTR